MSEYIKYKYDCSLHHFNTRFGDYHFFGCVKANTLTELKSKARILASNNNVNSRITISDLNSGISFNINP